jgi:uncharacterized protein YicC (UPF0701 family)
MSKTRRKVAKSTSTREQPPAVSSADLVLEEADRAGVCHFAEAIERKARELESAPVTRDVRDEVKELNRRVQAALDSPTRKNLDSVVTWAGIVSAYGGLCRTGPYDLDKALAVSISSLEDAAQALSAFILSILAKRSSGSAAIAESLVHPSGNLTGSSSPRYDPAVNGPDYGEGTATAEAATPQKLTETTDEAISRLRALPQDEGSVLSELSASALPLTDEAVGAQVEAIVAVFQRLFAAISSSQLETRDKERLLKRLAAIPEKTAAFFLEELRSLPPGAPLKLLTSQEVASQRGESRTLIVNYANQGRIGFRLGGKDYFFFGSEVQSFCPPPPGRPARR